VPHAFKVAAGLLASLEGIVVIQPQLGEMLDSTRGVMGCAPSSMASRLLARLVFTTIR
jgi:hypothetical protein